MSEAFFPWEFWKALGRLGMQDFAVAAILLFVVIGFLIFYLIVRLYVDHWQVGFRQIFTGWLLGGAAGLLAFVFLTLLFMVVVGGGDSNRTLIRYSIIAPIIAISPLLVYCHYFDISFRRALLVLLTPIAPHIILGPIISIWISWNLLVTDREAEQYHALMQEVFSQQLEFSTLSGENWGYRLERLNQTAYLLEMALESRFEELSVKELQMMENVLTAELNRLREEEHYYSLMTPEERKGHYRKLQQVSDACENFRKAYGE